MVLVDEYSRYPIVEIVRSVSTNTVILVLGEVLATFWYPEVTKSDNGYPFNSDAFVLFLQSIVDFIAEESPNAGQGKMHKLKV